MHFSKRKRLIAYTLWSLFICLLAFLIAWTFNINKMLLPLVVSLGVAFLSGCYFIYWKNEAPTFGIIHYYLKKRKRKDKNIL